MEVTFSEIQLMGINHCVMKLMKDAERCSCLVLKICDCVIVHSKRDFADVIKLKDSEMGRLSWMGPV